LLETIGADHFEHRLIDLSDKPDDFLEKYRLAAGSPVASGMVPLLEHQEQLVIESDVVAKYVAQNVGENDGMYPATTNPEACQTIDQFLSTWYPIVDKYYDLLCAGSVQSAKKRQEIFADSLSVLESQLLDDGFLLGDTFSLAECICAPWVQRFFVTLPYFRGIDFQEQILSPYPNVARWMAAVSSRPSVLESKCDEEEMLNAARRYYVSFVSPDAPGRL
jgi:glutathione S-transferase